jgi:hypothetical protein
VDKSERRGGALRTKRTCLTATFGVLELPVRRARRLVDQVLPDGEVHPLRDPGRTQDRGRADAGVLQDGWAGFSARPRHTSEWDVPGVLMEPVATSTSRFALTVYVFPLWSWNSTPVARGVASADSRTLPTCAPARTAVPPESAFVHNLEARD